MLMSYCGKLGFKDPELDICMTRLIIDTKPCLICVKYMSLCLIIDISCYSYVDTWALSIINEKTN